jgi:1-acyl-sn-glycerol-3-phosphate acyltransferase
MTDTPRPVVGLVWAAYEHLAMVLGLGFLALLCLVWLPFALLLHAALPEGTARRLGRRMIAFGFRVYLRFLGLCCACRFDLAALDRLRQDGALVVVANHPSLLDAVMILSRFPDMVCIMKAALLKNPLLGAAARLARYIPNDTPLNMILGACDELRAGAKLLVFPEGTRTGSFPVDACAPSAGLIAARAGVPVQALLIEFSSPYLGKAWPLLRAPRLPLRFAVRLGRRFAPPADAGEFTRELERHFRSELAAGS